MGKWCVCVCVVYVVCVNEGDGDLTESSTVGSSGMLVVSRGGSGCGCERMV